MTDCHFSK